MCVCLELWTSARVRHFNAKWIQITKCNVVSVFYYVQQHQQSTHKIILPFIRQSPVQFYSGTHTHENCQGQYEAKQAYHTRQHVPNLKWRTCSSSGRTDQNAIQMVVWVDANASDLNKWESVFALAISLCVTVPFRPVCVLWCERRKQFGSIIQMGKSFDKNKRTNLVSCPAVAVEEMEFRFRLHKNHTTAMDSNCTHIRPNEILTIGASINRHVAIELTQIPDQYNCETQWATNDVERVAATAASKTSQTELIRVICLWQMH